MDKILIANIDEQFLETLATSLKKAHQFHILLARSGDEAISILKEHKISVFVIDTEIHDIDILDLLEYMTQNCPKTPCIIMSDWGKPWFSKLPGQQSFLYFLTKPFDISALFSAIFVGLNLRDEGSHLKGMTMLSLLPLMEMFQKTCRMKVSAGEKNEGFLYFKDGILLDAHFGSLNGEAAAKEISTWQKIVIELSELPRHRNRKRLKKGIMDIADYSWTLQKTTLSGNNLISAGYADEPAIGNLDDTAKDDTDPDLAFQQEIEDMIDIDEVPLEDSIFEKDAAQVEKYEAVQDSILIVGSDREQQAAIRGQGQGFNRFEVLTASKGKEAIEVLEKGKVSVIVLDMHLPDMDCVDLFTHLTRQYPMTACIVMFDPDKPIPVFQNAKEKESMLTYIKKPFSPKTLARMILKGLHLKDKGFSINEITLKRLLPLAALCVKTCRMEVASETDGKGFLCFQDGSLLDAMTDSQSGLDAARQMTEWSKVEVTTYPLSEQIYPAKINTKIIEICGAVWQHSWLSPQSHENEKQKLVKTTQTESASPKESLAALGQKGEGLQLDAALKRYAVSLRAIKGYRGVAVLSPDGSILATDTADEPFDFSSFASELKSIIACCNKTANQSGLSQCTGVTLHTKKGIVTMMCADTCKHDNLYFIGVLAPNANGFFMQVQLEKAIPYIQAYM